MPRSILSARASARTALPSARIGSIGGTGRASSTAATPQYRVSLSRSRLPPLNAIKAFEAAARLGSFTRAAGELNVNHGAVSRQIRLLKDWLGVRLFLRTSRNAVPTQAGSELLAEASPALDRLAVVSRQMQNRAGARGLLLPKGVSVTSIVTNTAEQLTLSDPRHGEQPTADRAVSAE